MCRSCGQYYTSCKSRLLALWFAADVLVSKSGHTVKLTRDGLFTICADGHRLWNFSRRTMPCSRHSSRSTARRSIPWPKLKRQRCELGPPVSGYSPMASLSHSAASLSHSTTCRPLSHLDLKQEGQRWALASISVFDTAPDGHRPHPTRRIGPYRC